MMQAIRSEKVKMAARSIVQGKHLNSDLALCIHQYVSGSQQESSGSSPRYRIRDILAKHLPEYLARHGDELTPYKIKTLRLMSMCGSGQLGYIVSVCSDCGKISWTPSSCGNSNCPSCGALRREKWIREREAEVISGMTYHHLVFTMPHELNSLVYNNQKLLLDLFFHSAQEALLELCLEVHKIKPGIVMVLHTFGSSMTLHYHLHVLISAGGLFPDNESFKRIKGYFLPVQKISGCFRRNFMTGLRNLYKKDRLSFSGTAAPYQNREEFQKLCDACYQNLWNVNLKKYGSFNAEEKKEDESLPDVEKVIGYFGRYTNRTAIAPSRIREWTDSGVAYEYKDYHTDGSYDKKVMKVTPEEFIRRLSLHILPKGFRKVRMAGYLSGNVRQKNLRLIHRILQDDYTPCMLRGMKSNEVIRLITGKDPTVCEECSRPMIRFYFNTDGFTVFLRTLSRTDQRWVELFLHPRGPDGKHHFINAVC